MRLTWAHFFSVKVIFFALRRCMVRQILRIGGRATQWFDRVRKLRLHVPRSPDSLCELPTSPLNWHMRREIHFVSISLNVLVLGP